jgi:hypothetical protein
MRFSIAGIGILVSALLLLPAAASAAVRKVEPSGADTGDCTASACKTVQYAANEGDGGDTVEIAEGTYTETVQTSTALNFIGAGDEATIIRGPNGSGAAGHPAFILPNGGSLSSLSADGGNGANGVPNGFAGAYAIVFEPGGLDQDQLRLEAVDARGGDGGSGSVVLSGAAGGGGIVAIATEGGKTVTAVDSTLASGEGAVFTTATAVALSGAGMSGEFVGSEIDASSGLIATGLGVQEGATASIATTGVHGFYGAGAEGGSLTARRSLIEGAQWGLVVTPGLKPAVEAKVFDSVVQSKGPAAYVTGGAGNEVARLVANGSDFISKGAGPAVETKIYSPAQPVSALLRNSIALDIPEEAEPKRDLVANGGTIEAEHSNFSTSTQENGGTAPAPGSGTNVAGDPGFAGPKLLNLAPNSPLIDRGDPPIVESGETDIKGTPRSLDGDRDCIAAPDIGAFEVAGQSAPCPPKVADAIPVVSGFGITNKTFAPKGKKPAKASGVKRGTKFTYSLSEPAQIAIKIERRKPGKGRPKYAKVTTIGGQQRSGKDATPFSGKVKGKALKPGKYRATIIATDAAGQASAPRQLNFKVISG